MQCVSHVTVCLPACIVHFAKKKSAKTVFICVNSAMITFALFALQLSEYSFVVSNSNFVAL